MHTSTPADPTSPHDGDGFSQPTSRATELGQRAAAAIDDKKDAFASGLASAASTLHARAEDLPGGEKVARAAHSAAEAIANAADYVRDQDLKDVVSDVRDIARRNPGVTLLTAVAVGFLLARSLSRH